LRQAISTIAPAFAVERLAAVVRLDDGELAKLHALEGREAGTAILALAAAADGRAVLVGRLSFTWLSS
jgi:hypothetical protein